MNKEIEKLYNFIKTDMKEIKFDRGLFILRKHLWDIADRYNTTGDVVFTKLMEYWCSVNNY